MSVILCEGEVLNIVTYIVVFILVKVILHTVCSYALKNSKRLP